MAWSLLGGAALRLVRAASASLTLGGESLLSSLLLETASLLLCAPVPSVCLHESMPMTVPFGCDLDPKLSAAASCVLSHAPCEAGHLDSSALCVSVLRCDSVPGGVWLYVQAGWTVGPRLLSLASPAGKVVGPWLISGKWDIGRVPWSEQHTLPKLCK